MKKLKLSFGLFLIGGLPVPPAAHSSEFLLDKAADVYCASMVDMKPREMTSYNRGLFEGMAFGFVLGQYPEQVDSFQKMDVAEINNLFYPMVKKKCPGKAFQ